MKILDTSLIVAGAGYPPSKKGIDFLQKSYQEILIALAQGIAGKNEAIGTSSYVLSGCQKTDLGAGNFSFAAGWIYNSNTEEVYYFPYVATIAIPANPVLTITTTYSGTYNPVLFTDNTNQNVHKQNNLIVSSGALGSADINYEDLIFVSNEWIANDVNTSYRRSSRSVELFGVAGAVGTAMGNGTTSFTLPVGYRPSVTQTIKGVVFYDTGADTGTGTLTVNTNGTIYHSALTGAGTARWITLTGIRFNV